MVQKAVGCAIKDVYLWPRTPVANIQAEIWARCGYTDWVRTGRVGNILDTLQEMLVNNLLREDFTYFDICTGDALIPWRVQHQFPFSRCYGMDIRRYSTYEMVTRHGVELYRIPIQDLFLDHDIGQFDIVSMLNTYRGWGSADLSGPEAWLPGAADDWFKQHARYIIITTHDRQKQIDAGFWVKQIGRGESGSDLVIMWPSGADQWNQ